MNAFEQLRRFRLIPSANPRIHVNPLSPLAPGILRSLFEFRGR